MDTAGRASSGEPWLRNRQWASRELVDQRGLGWAVLLIAYVVGAATLAGVWATLREGAGEKSIGVIVLAVFVIGILAVLTRLRVRGMRYGKTVCRLITLPGVVGGWFKADVRCGLPPHIGPVTVRLKNTNTRGRFTQLLWSMEQSCPLEPLPGNGDTHSIVKVRLRVPRDRSQRFILPDMEFLLGAPADGVAWILEVEKKSRGVDFAAVFNVPIYDTRGAPPAEQADSLA